MTENQHQIALIKWTQQPSIRLKYPDIKLLYHIANERKCSEIQGRLLKLLGVKKGIPDLDLPVARHGYHGLRIELKSEAGKPTPEQDWWIEELKNQGYFGEVCYGWQNAVKVIEWYLGGE